MYLRFSSLDKSIKLNVPMISFTMESCANRCGYDLNTRRGRARTMFARQPFGQQGQQWRSKPLHILPRDFALLADDAEAADVEEVDEEDAQGEEDVVEEEEEVGVQEEEDIVAEEGEVGVQEEEHIVVGEEEVGVQEGNGENPGQTLEAIGQDDEDVSMKPPSIMVDQGLSTRTTP
jgi:hypothetical protein